MRSIGGLHRNVLPGPIENISVLRSAMAEDWQNMTESFYLTIPQSGLNEMATVFKLELE